MSVQCNYNHEKTGDVYGTESGKGDTNGRDISGQEVKRGDAGHVKMELEDVSRHESKDGGTNSYEASDALQLAREVKGRPVDVEMEMEPGSPSQENSTTGTALSENRTPFELCDANFDPEESTDGFQQYWQSFRLLIPAELVQSSTMVMQIWFGNESLVDLDVPLVNESSMVNIRMILPACVHVEDTRARSDENST